MYKLVFLTLAIISAATGAVVFSNYLRNNKGVLALYCIVSFVSFYYTIIQIWYVFRPFFNEYTSGAIQPHDRNREANPLQPKKAQVCTSLSKSDIATINSTVWRVGSGSEIKQRIRLEINEPNRYTSILHFIVDSQTGYAWTNPDKPGTKYSVEKKPVIDILPSSEMNEKCQDWTPDYSLFEVPKNIHFTDD